MDARESRAIPVEYAVAVDRFLDASRLSPASRRVYQISLNTWSWLLIDRTPPPGVERRNARTPVVPLARLDGPRAATRLRAARERRALTVDERTLERESAILRTALGWWAARGWIDPTAGDERRSRRIQAPKAPADAPASESGSIDVEAVLALRAPLREQAFWHLLYESAAPVEHVLALDVADLDLNRRRIRRRITPGPTERISWGDGTAALLPLLLAGRSVGPVFLTQRRASASTPAADRCPFSGRGRLSARRAAELFNAATRPLDPGGDGWTLRDLRIAGRVARGLRVRRDDRRDREDPA